MYRDSLWTLNGGVLLGIGRVPPPRVPVHPLRARAGLKPAPTSRPLTFHEGDGGVSVVWLASRSQRYESASERLSHKPTVPGFDLRWITLSKRLVGTVADRLGKLLMLTRSGVCPSRRPEFQYSIVGIFA